MIEPNYQSNELTTPYSQVNQSENLPDSKKSIWQKFKFKSQEYFSWLWILILAIYIVSNTVHSVVKNYYSNLEIAKTEQNITKLQIEKERLKALIAYYGTASYKEKEIRQRLLLKKPGEYVIAFPEEVRSEKLEVSSKSDNNQVSGPKKANYEKWIDYFRGKL